MDSISSTSTNESIAERIKALRKETRLTQEELAKQLGVSRATFSQMENGERKITAEELYKLANIFNVTADEILNTEKSIKVVLKKGKTQNKKEQRSIRISVPQRNVKKFKEVLLYILNKVGAKPNVGETVIYKLLYFIDFDFYEKYEEQLIGATYVKNKYGPTPIEFKAIVKEMVKNGEIIVLDKEYFKYPQRKYLPLKAPDLSVLRAHEKELIDEVLDRLSDMSAKEISEYSHNDIPWMGGKLGEVIDYEAVFYRTKGYSVRRYKDEDREST